MPDINNSLAMQVNTSPLNLQSTLGTISQIQLAQAHAGLYGLQAQQEARKLAGFEYLKANPTDYLGAIKSGLDPAVGQTLQMMNEREKQYQVGGGLSAESTQQFTGAAKNRAETGKIGVETTAASTDLGSKIAQGVIANPSNDSVWQNAVEQHYQTFGGPSLERQQMLAIKDPKQRMQIAKAYAAQGVPPGTFGAPHNVSPTETVTTPGASYSTPQEASVATNRPGGALQSTPAMIGDDEAVRKGLYSPTPEQRARGVTGPAQSAPNQRVAGGFGTIAPAMTPGQQKESEAYGGEVAKVLPALADKANQSRQSNFTLDQMRNESQTWDMGKGAQTLLTAGQYLKSAAAVLGMQNTFLDKPIADYESFNKNAGTLVRQAVKEVSSRAAVQEFNLIQKQLPSSDMTRKGFNQIADQFQSVNDFNIAKHQAGQAWRDAAGSMDKFETEWNKNITPTAFFVSRLPPDQVGALKANLERTPEGRVTLRSLTKQLQWAHDHNLDQLVK
jgi:hypothetical protein